MPVNFYTLMRKPIPQPAGNPTSARYEQIAGDYQQRHMAFKSAEAHQRFTAALPPPARVLEIGCGPGRDATMLQAGGYRVVALDPAWAMLELAQPSGAACVQADGRAVPILAGSVDGVWASAALLHLPRLELAIALTEIRRVLRPDGVLYCSFKRGVGEAASDGRWLAYYQPDEIARMLRGADFALRDQWEAADSRPGAPPWIMTLARAATLHAATDQATDECGTPIDVKEQTTEACGVLVSAKEQTP